MKKWLAKLLAFVMMFSIVSVSAAYIQTETVVSAADVALSVTSKTVILGNTYTITLKNTTNVKKTAWKSSNTKVATVSSKGSVTPVKAGSAVITCTVTLTTGKTQSLTCKVTVKARVAATAVKLNVIHDEMNAHIIKVGEKYDFNSKLTPSNSTDTTYYTIADADIATVTSTGVVTGKKAGVTVLEARVGLNKTQANKSTNKVVARTYILVQPKATSTPTPTPTPTATPTPTPTVEPKVLDVALVSAKEIQVTFNVPIQKSSIIDSNGDLIEGIITVSEGKNAKMVGKLSAKISEDETTLNLNAEGEFEGTYVISVFNKIVSKDNQIIPTASFQRDFKDQVGPVYLNSEVDDTGYICYINFNEAIDISGLSITSVNGTSITTIKSYLTSVSSYVLSSDKKTLQINLASIGAKEFSAMVNMIGIKDVKGNYSPMVQISALVRCDATAKPLANIVDVERVNKNLFVATFDRAIQYPGVAIVGSDYCNGVINPDNNKQVNYTINNTSITGTKLVEFSGFLNYNATYSSNTKVTRYVDFTLDTTAPSLVGYEFTMTSESGTPIHKLTLTYDKKISAVNGSGSLSTVVNSTNGIIATKNIAYTATTSDKVLTLVFANQTFAVGSYTITLPIGLVIDTLGNLSTTQTIAVYKQAGSSLALPAPAAIIQDASNPSKILVTFANKLDIASAQNPSNYILDGNTTPISAIIKEQTEISATIELTFAPGAIENTTTHAISVDGVKGYNDSYGTMNVYYTMLTLIENCAPNLTSCKLTNSNSVQISFTENITGTGVFQMVGSTGILNIDGVYVNGNTIYLSLPETVTSGSVCILINSNSITDTNNNVVQLPTQIVASK